MESKNVKEVVQYADYEFVRKSKVGKYIQSGEEFFLLDMDRKRIYCSSDLRLRDLSEKLKKESVYVIKRATYS